jgi:uncharacterized membrane protein
MGPRQNFLATVQGELTPLPDALIQDILDELDWHFRAASQAGRAEAEAARRLGDPVRLARELREAAGHTVQ